MEKFSVDENAKYWENTSTKSLIDSCLKQLEIDFIIKYLKNDFDVIDLGCGDGETIVAISKLVKNIKGIERSNLFLQKAVTNVNTNNLKNVTIEPGDILKSKINQKYDVAITERVLINLPSWELQHKAIENIHKILKPGGLYLMIENTTDGQNALNKLRSSVNLKPIEIHWHNLYLDFNLFKDSIKGKFNLIERESFSAYYLLTRVFTPMFAKFEGYGSNAKFDEIFKISDPAAKELHNKIGKLIEIKENNNIIGPIQGFVLQKI